MSVEKERLSSIPFLPDWIWKEHMARFVFVATLCQNKDILDCACGSGVGTQYFSKQARSVQAIDISLEALAEAKKRSQNNTNVIFSQGSATNIPLPDASVDIYISLETIEHLNEIQPYLREALRVLRTGGTFVCSTPNRAVTNPGKKISDKPTNPFHVREFNTGEFTELLREHFVNVALSAQNPVNGSLVTLLNTFGKFLPLNFTTRIHQAIKLITSFFRNDQYYAVRPAQKDTHYEYVLAVCTKK